MFNTGYSYRSIQLSLLDYKDEGLYCAVMTDKACMQYVRPVLSAEEANTSFLAALKWNARIPLKHVYLTVSLKTSGQAIGIASVNFLDIGAKTADLGRMLLPQWQGKGLGSELSCALIKWLALELGINCFTKHIHVGNTIAIKSTEKLGFSVAKTIMAVDKEPTQLYQLTLT